MRTLLNVVTTGIYAAIISATSVYAAAPEVKEDQLLRNSGEISGVVSDCSAETSLGWIAYIPGESFSARTDSNGLFRLRYVPEGDYVLHIENSKGYSESLNVSVGRNSIQEVSIDYCPDADSDTYTVDVDCNDNNSSINPGATESCDGIDNNCNGVADELPECTNCDDSDHDNYFAQENCSTAVDCDDNVPVINPGASERCNGFDDNCDGLVDEGFDSDGDGYTICGGDCRDSDSQINPDAVEVCDGMDNNCATGVDEDGVCSCDNSQLACGYRCVEIDQLIPDSTCGNLEYLGNLSGDEGSESLLANQKTGSKIYRVTVTEDSAQDAPIGVQVTLSGASGTNFDLEVWCGSCSNPGGSTKYSRTVTSEEEVYFWWDDTFLTSDNRDIYIKVTPSATDWRDRSWGGDEYECRTNLWWSLEVSGNRVSGSSTDCSD